MSNRFSMSALCSIAALAALGAAAPAAAQQTNNGKLRAVPAPGKVVIDGKLDDWDLSGEILICYDLSTLANKYSVRAAAMYDRDFFYMSFHFKDPLPMINHIDPKQDPGGGWKSDCVQMRLMTDRMAWVDCWYYSDAKQPCISIHYGGSDPKSPDAGDVPDALATGAREAFIKDADGKGFVQEVALPWKLLSRSGQIYGPGKSFRMGLECLWGDSTGRANAIRYADLIDPAHPQREFFWANARAWGQVSFLDHGKLPPSPSVQQLSQLERYKKLQYATRGPVALSYTLPADGAATLVIEKPDGTRVRNLIGDYPRKAGKNVDYWDGTDDGGRLVAPGEYRVRGLFHKDLDLLYQFCYGNPGNPAWITTDEKGGWLSNHENPFAVTADDTRIYVAAPQAEGATSVLAIDYTGQRQWGFGNICGGMMARWKGYLYLLTGGYPYYQPGVPNEEIRLVRMDAATGRYAPFADKKPYKLIATIPPIDKWWVPRESFGWTVAHRAFNAQWAQRQTMGLACDGKRLYASLYYENRIVVVDPDKGETVGTYAVDHPAGLAGGAPGTLYAISGTTVVKVDAKGKTTPVVTAGLEAPVGLARDRAGNLYVSDWGAAMCVKAFGPDGKLIRTIGTLGGRPLSGKYDPKGMFMPWGLATDQRGRLWVAEYDESPRRISVWNTRTGQFEREFCGSTWYAGNACNVNPYEPRQAFVMGNTVELDWAKGLWRVTGTLCRPTRPDDLFTMMSGNAIRYKGETYLVSHTGEPAYVIIGKLHRDHVQPLTAMGHVFNLGRTGEKLPELVLKHLVDTPAQLEALRKRFPKAFIGQGRDEYQLFRMLSQPGVHCQFLWTDQNGDGHVQEKEIHFYTRELSVQGQLREMYLFRGPGWNCGVAPDLTLYFATVEDHQDHLYQWRPRQFNVVGAPVYDPRDVKRVVKDHGNWMCDTWVDGQGQVWVDDNPLRVYSAEGRLRWTYPNQWQGVGGSHSAPADKRGRLIGTLFALGSAEVPKVGEVMCYNGNLGEKYLFTTDGLYVASLLRDARGGPEILPDHPQRGMSVMACTGGGEPFGGEFFRNSADGKVYLGGPVGNCREASMLCEVTGLDTIRRLPAQPVQFTAKDYEAGARLLGEKARSAKAAKTISLLSRPQPSPKAPRRENFDWSEKRIATWQYDTRHSAMATWSYDAKNLYLCFRDVLDDTPMINNGKDATTLFKTGDAVEFELRTQPGNDTPDVIAGDLRLVLSVFQGRPVAVLYRYKVPGTAKPVRFSSPVGTVLVDQVQVLAEAKVVIDRQAGRYTVCASVPLAALGFAPTPGKTYRGDFGLVYSDRGGQINELRMYWSNPVTGMINDLPSETRIQPAMWGRFQIEAPKVKK